MHPDGEDVEAPGEDDDGEVDYDGARHGRPAAGRPPRRPACLVVDRRGARAQPGFLTSCHLDLFNKNICGFGKVIGLMLG